QPHGSGLHRHKSEHEKPEEGKNTIDPSPPMPARIALAVFPCPAKPMPGKNDQDDQNGSCQRREMWIVEEWRQG
ncbi:hypothetical protein MD537_22010, partial [Flavihumibacter sediminis]|nr:hypothetical protein [Flavihumibacter sediminis]